MIQRSRRWGGAIAVFFGTLFVCFFLPPLPDALQDLRADSSLILTDREGRPLRLELSARQGVNDWVLLSEVPKVLIDAVLTAEDKRFFYHPGVDPIAIGRSASSNLRARQVVSGASTLTAQLIRTLETERPPNFSNKLRELYWSVRLEAHYSKDELLEAYLNRVAFGPSVYGVAEASRYYFDKPASSLSTAQAATLAVLIRSPSLLDPFTPEGSSELERWTPDLLERLSNRGFISSQTAQRALTERLELSDRSPPFFAPHFCELASSAANGERGQVRTTLDLTLQTAVEGAVRSQLAVLESFRVGNAAVVVIDVDSGEILSLVGSREFSSKSDGQVNAADSLRQPGSTIKPFTYALLLERVQHPGVILPDLNLYEDSALESFIPNNYDRRFHGPVSIRTALASSFNVPVVRALERVGITELLALLNKVGFDDLTESPEHYGLGLTLGNGSASLLQLVGAYRSLARGGVYSPLRLFPQEGSHLLEGHERRVLSARSSFLITDILSDDAARIAGFGRGGPLEFPFPVAVKTGTSKGYRDNWCVGYTPKHVVGVWVGNSDGSPMREVSGITGAGALFRDVMLLVGDGGEFTAPAQLSRVKVCALSGELAHQHCPSQIVEWCFEEAQLKECSVCQVDDSGRYFVEMPSLYQRWAEVQGLPVAESSTQHPDRLRFTYPRSGDTFLLDSDLKKEYQRVKFRVAGGTPPYRWSLNGRPVSDAESDTLWWQLFSGSHHLVVEDAHDQKTEISVEVRGK